MTPAGVVRASWPRPSGPGGGLASHSSRGRLVGPAGRHLGPDRGHVLVQFGCAGQVTGCDSVQDYLPDLVRQPQGDRRQWDRKL
jgi:hypothetical protein